MLFLAAGMLFPWSLPDDFDGEQHFMYNRRWFFGINTLCWLIDIPETLSKADGGLREAPSMYIMFSASMLTIAITGAVTKNKTIHAILAIAWPLITVSYLGITTLAEIAISGR